MTLMILQCPASVGHHLRTDLYFLEACTCFALKKISGGDLLTKDHCVQNKHKLVVFYVRIPSLSTDYEVNDDLLYLALLS